ncbi:adenylyl-sulfate kinase [Ferrovibrio sp.]|uniref:adenylyl-sulfate kinase n=1 Tax=Ferrovibrio sp. TaxID=1917215 RepID=UPI0025C48076|nr:adenylyl-sulfate kinase [Ferrovibrio sp.]MBX3456234.1 adenylyl-sulfate kinase [Ferrovibrio sp.]
MKQGSVVWLTGISGAGKTTIAEAIHAQAKPYLPELVLIDGDVIRDLFGAGLGFHEAARHEQIGRIQRLARMLAEQGLVVLVAALYAHPDLLAWNRANLPGYVEVYVNTPLPLVQSRDVKGLYAKAAAGAMPNVVGLDIPWHAPAAPDLVIDGNAGETPQQSAARVIAVVPRLQAAMMGGGR